MSLLQRSSPLVLALTISAAILGLRCEKSDETVDISDPGIVKFVQSLPFHSDLVQGALQELTKSPHPLGSARQSEIANFLLSKAQQLSLKTYQDSFEAEVPNPILLDQPDSPAPLTLTREGQNIIARTQWSKPCVIAFGSHYDTKEMEQFDYHGANDSASSSAALLWILAALANDQGKENLSCDLMAIWFDGEEAILTDWNDGLLRHPAKIQDNTYGSRHLANRLTSCEENSQELCWPTELGGGRFKTLILLDMIGSPQLRITPDLNSDPTLLELAASYDQQLFDQPIVTGSRRAIEDDHIPFRQRNLSAINLIDFENLNYWHRPGDDLETLDLGSIEKAARLAMALALALED